MKSQVDMKEYLDVPSAELVRWNLDVPPALKEKAVNLLPNMNKRRVIMTVLAHTINLFERNPEAATSAFLSGKVCVCLGKDL